MTKKRVSKTTKHKDEDITSPKNRPRLKAACAMIARTYCDWFEFWRDCRFKPCRSARRCVGDQRGCLELRWYSVPHEAGTAAQRRMLAETPPHADRFIRSAHLQPHHSLLLHGASTQKMRAKIEAKRRSASRLTTQAKINNDVRS